MPNGSRDTIGKMSLLHCHSIHKIDDLQGMDGFIVIFFQFSFAV